MYNAELQQLREIAWFICTQLHCIFCRQPLISSHKLSFGHRRHPKFRTKLTIHHRDLDRKNNEPSNLALVHSDCHKRFHKLLEHGGSNGEKEKDATQKEEVKEVS
jgi:hypothetical protein